MSLRVWLPLNGNLNNQGVSNITVTNSNATVDVSGKIGSCYSFNGSTSCIDITYANFPTILNGDFSICLWIYSNDNNDRSIYFGNWGLTGAFLNIEKTANNKVRFYWNGAPDLTPANTTITASTWNHLVITRQGNIVKFYINGTLTDTSTTTLTGNIPSNATIFRLGRDNRTDSTAFNGKFNDFRLYDHCLSAKEAKEISKGLVLHYPLDGSGKGGDNYYLNSNFYTSSTSNWYGVNGSSISIIEKDNRKVITGTKGTSSNLFGQTITNYSYTANSEITFTISADIYAETSGTIYIGNWISTSQASGWQAMSFTEVWNTSNVLKVGWNHVSVTHKNTKNQYNGNIVTAFGYSSATYFATNIKFEFGDIDTPWCPNSTETIYTTLGYNSTTEIDTSGYKRNALIVSTTPSIESNSPKYNCSYKYSGSINNIYYNTTTDFNLTDNFSWSSWFKPNYTGTTAQYAFTVGRADAGGYGYGFQIMSSTQTRVWFGSSQWAWTTAVANNEWRHIVFTKNGTAINVYENGVAKVSATFGGTLPTYSDGAGIGIGGFHYSGGNIYPYYGNISDFRIYATALSTDDVKELYQSSASITNNGSILAYDFTEQ